MMPAQQRLHSDDIAGGQFYLGLVLKFEFATPYCSLKIVCHLMTWTR